MLCVPRRWSARNTVRRISHDKDLPSLLDRNNPRGRRGIIGTSKETGFVERNALGVEVISASDFLRRAPTGHSHHSNDEYSENVKHDDPVHDPPGSSRDLLGMVGGFTGGQDDGLSTSVGIGGADKGAVEGRRRRRRSMSRAPKHADVIHHATRLKNAKNLAFEPPPTPGYSFMAPGFFQ